MMDDFLAIDIGASSGRHILFRIEDGRLQMQEVYRFPNGMTEKNGGLCWDYDAIFAHILTGMKRCKVLGRIPKSVGIDTWGVDFVLLDAQDKVIGDTFGYRDRRTEGMEAEVSRRISPEELYRRTGIQKASYNTIYQLMALKKHHPEDLTAARAFLMTPDYLHWRLCGRKANEYTEASTSQLLDPTTRLWNFELIERLGYPREIFCEIIPPGTVLGNLTPEIQSAVGFNCSVVAPATHDTASAIAAMPSEEPDAVYLSSGTWSLLGIELDRPDCGENSHSANFTNEGGFGGRICYLKNIMGLWMIQRVRAELAEAGMDYSYAALGELAETVQTAAIVPCGDDRFLSPKSMIQEIRAACVESGQPVPETPAALAATVYRSLARCYAEAVEQLRRNWGKPYRSLYIFGGGSNAGYLNRLTAEETGCTVSAGPAEATAIGNAVIQMIQAGVFLSEHEAKQCIAASFPMAKF